MTVAEPPDVSVVLPCFRSASLALRAVDRLGVFLDDSVGRWEIVVVDDGGHDFPDEPFREITNVRLVQLPQNRGKGAAVRAGMQHAHGLVRVFTDVDLPYDLDLIPVMASCIRELGYHLVIGDRTLPGSTYSTITSWKRRLASALFSDVVGRVVTGGFFDTQCGLKAVRGDIADLLFPLQRVDRFAFDVELVYLALKSRLDIKRIPVQLRNNQTSTIRLFRDSTQGVVDIVRIKYHQVLGHYRCDALDRITHDEFMALRKEVLEARDERADCEPRVGARRRLP
jgi:glycosyltransferase involved in cell wall biosynthesis